MTQYIDKDALIAEIDRRLENLYKLLPDASKVENGSITISESCNTGKYTALESLKDYVDTLEMKEINSADALIEKSCKLLVNCIEDFMARRMEIWNEECKKQTLENLRKALKE